MSNHRFRRIAGIWGQYTSRLLYIIFHPLHLLIILTLRWLYETPLDTVQEVARGGKGRWARQMAGLKPDGSQRAEPSGNMGEYNINLSHYIEAGTQICVALAHWTFWLWLAFPVKYWFLTIPAALAGAFYVWRYRMIFLGPGYQFACDREIEDVEDAMQMQSLTNV
ncbi:hypothetical protein BDZ89DRAFT_1070335 [Hymenopellis radicata]|nr:hypothetical protein BDZ89DRAFT_1070335 [Hymenopellis radicata]